MGRVYGLLGGTAPSRTNAARFIGFDPTFQQHGLFGANRKQFVLQRIRCLAQLCEHRRRDIFEMSPRGTVQRTSVSHDIVGARLERRRSTKRWLRRRCARSITSNSTFRSSRNLPGLSKPSFPLRADAAGVAVTLCQAAKLTSKRAPRFAEVVEAPPTPSPRGSSDLSSPAVSRTKGIAVTRAGCGPDLGNHELRTARAAQAAVASRTPHTPTPACKRACQRRQQATWLRRRLIAHGHLGRAPLPSVSPTTVCRNRDTLANQPMHGAEHGCAHERAATSPCRRNADHQTRFRRRSGVGVDDVLTRPRCCGTDKQRAGMRIRLMPLRRRVRADSRAGGRRRGVEGEFVVERIHPEMNGVRRPGRRRSSPDRPARAAEHVCVFQLPQQSVEDRRAGRIAPTQRRCGSLRRRRVRPSSTDDVGEFGHNPQPIARPRLLPSRSNPRRVEGPAVRPSAVAAMRPALVVVLPDDPFFAALFRLDKRCSARYIRLRDGLGGSWALRAFARRLLRVRGMRRAGNPSIFLRRRRLRCDDVRFDVREHADRRRFDVLGLDNAMSVGQFAGGHGQTMRSALRDPDSYSAAGLLSCTVSR